MSSVSRITDHKGPTDGPDNDRTVRLAGTKLGSRAHICAFFDNTDDEFDVLLPFVREGLDLGEKACHTVNPQHRLEHLNRLSSAGIDHQALHRSGQFELRDWDDTKLSEPRFDGPRTLSIFDGIARVGRSRGFPLTRFITHMDWFVETSMDADDLLEYEARANDIWIKGEGPVDPVICTYDLKKFSGEIVINVMRTHPLIVIGGILQENPFFVHPEEFLKTLGKKRVP